MIVRDPNPTVEALEEVLPSDDWYLEGDGDAVAFAYNADFRGEDAEVTRSIEIRDDGLAPWTATISIPGSRGFAEPVCSESTDTLEDAINWVADHYDDEF